MSSASNFYNLHLISKQERHAKTKSSVSYLAIETEMQVLYLCLSHLSVNTPNAQEEFPKMFVVVSLNFRLTFDSKIAAAVVHTAQCI